MECVAACYTFLDEWIHLGPIFSQTWLRMLAVIKNIYIWKNSNNNNNSQRKYLSASFEKTNRKTTKKTQKFICVYRCCLVLVEWKETRFVDRSNELEESMRLEMCAMKSRIRNHLFFFCFLFFFCMRMFKIHKYCLIFWVKLHIKWSFFLDL